MKITDIQAKQVKSALVLGITGGFGYHMAMELLNKGWQVTAMIRDLSKIDESFEFFLSQNRLKLIKGDANDSEQVEEAAQGCLVLVYGINIPYTHWNKSALPLLDSSSKVAEKLGMCIVFPGNVYNFDPENTPLIFANSPQQEVTEKGIIRIAMERRLEKASNNGAKVLIVRAGDFLGKYAPSAWIHHLVKPTSNSFQFFSAAQDDARKHNWCYLPELSDIAVQLLELPSGLKNFEVVGVPGLNVSSNDIAAALNRISGQPIKTKKLPWWLYRLLGRFIPMINEIVKMRYLWDSDLSIDGTDLARLLPQHRQANLETALIGSGFSLPKSDIAMHQMASDSQK